MGISKKEGKRKTFPETYESLLESRLILLTAQGMMWAKVVILWGLQRNLSTDPANNTCCPSNHSLDSNNETYYMLSWLEGWCTISWAKSIFDQSPILNLPWSLIGKAFFDMHNTTK